jgi:hypothetical protein
MKKAIIIESLLERFIGHFFAVNPIESASLEFSPEKDLIPTTFVDEDGFPVATGKVYLSHLPQDVRSEITKLGAGKHTI